MFILKPGIIQQPGINKSLILLLFQNNKKKNETMEKMIIYFIVQIREM